MVLPTGIVSTGFPATEATCQRIGILFDPWQTDLNRCLLAKDAEGTYAADTVALSIPRQVGKTFDVGGVVFADSIINPGTTTVWTAHRFKVARESFNEMRGWARTSRLKQHIDADEITTAAGNECIPFRNGSRIVFAARERGAIRGFTKVRRLILDEAQILTEHALSDLAPTQNQAVNPQIVFMGTPPKPTDPGEVFTRLRTEALDGISDGVLYVEFSAPPDATPDDREAWRIANPSYPRRTSEKAILRLRKLLSDEDFRREALGIWDDYRNTAPIPTAAWSDRTDTESEVVDPVAFALDITPERAAASIGLAGRRSDGNLHVEIIDYRSGTGWIVDRVVELRDRWKPCAVVVDGRGPAASLLPELKDRGVEALTTGTSEMAQACGMLYDAAVDSRTLRHLGQHELNTALAGAQKRPLGDAWAWSRKSSSTDISPLVAVTLALFGFATRMPAVPLVAWR